MLTSGVWYIHIIRNNPQILHRVIVENPERLFTFIKKRPLLIEKLSVLVHNFVFRENSELLRQRKELCFSDLEAPSFGKKPTSASLLSQYSCLYSNLAKLSNNSILKAFLQKTKQSADKIEDENRLKEERIRPILKIFRLPSINKNEKIREYFAAMKIVRFLTKKILAKRKMLLSRNSIQKIKIGMGKKFLFQLMRQSSAVMSHIRKRL